MLTITFLVAEIWRVLWKPRGANLVRKSSFRTQEQRDQLQKKYQQEQQQKQLEESKNSQQTEQQQLLVQPLATQSSPKEDRKAAGRIPIASKQVVPGVSPKQPQVIRPQTIQPHTASSTQATPPSEPPPPLQQQQVQQQQLQSQPGPSHIPTPVQKSVKTLVLQPSTPANTMSNAWVRQQVQNIETSFDQADKDKSGSLSFQEVYDVLIRDGFKGTQQEAQAIFGHMDQDKDKSISREEFKAAVNGLPVLSLKEFALRKAFLQLDKDKSGRLTRTEIIDATKNQGEIELSAEKISDLLVYLSKEDKDDKINYDQFLRALNVEMTAMVMHQIFTKIDADGSGFLSRTEILDTVHSESELKLRADKISDLLIYWCKDEDKKISYDEFIAVWLKEKDAKK